MTRAKTRAVVFNVLAGRATGRYRKAFEAFEKFYPAKAATLIEAHGGGDREAVDWAHEASAVDEFASVLAYWYGVSR